VTSGVAGLKIESILKFASSTRISAMNVDGIDNNDADSSLPHELKSLSTLLDSQAETLATGNAKICAAALNAAKYIFDLCPYFLYLVSLRCLTI